MRVRAAFRGFAWISVEWGLFPTPASRGRFPSNCAPLFAGQTLCPGFPAFAAKFDSRLVLAVLGFSRFLHLACRDPHDMDRVADNIRGALLTFRTLGHM